MTEVKPNKCCVCGKTPLLYRTMTFSACRVYCDYRGCLVGPGAATEREAILAWNRLRYVKPRKKVKR